jgi:cell division protein FtsB
MKKALIICGAVILVLALVFLGFLFMFTRSDLNTAKNDLDLKITELNIRNMELDSTREELEQTIGDLNKKDNELSITQEKLNTATKNLDDTKLELENTRTELDEEKATENSLKKDIDVLNDKIDKIDSQVQSLTKDLILYKETFGEVFQGVDPGITVYDAEPTGSFYYPFTSTPTRDLKLTNNKSAHNPTYRELLLFLQKDKSDAYRYIYGYYVCSNFAESVHNNAEAAGIRAAYVLITFEEGPGHAINAFLTEDKGLVYIDCTGSQAINKVASMDSYIDNLKIGNTYIRKFLFNSVMEFETSDNKVRTIQIFW